MKVAKLIFNTKLMFYLDELLDIVPDSQPLERNDKSL